MPIDAGLDAAGVLAGIGFAAKGLLTALKLPFYALYNAYYAGKTHDVKGAIKNFGYEAVSWMTPGSLPHAFNYYTHQAEDYAAEKGAERFLNSLERRAKVIPFPKKKPTRGSDNLEKIAQAN